MFFPCTATTAIYTVLPTLSLHDALPIFGQVGDHARLKIGWARTAGWPGNFYPLVSRRDLGLVENHPAAAERVGMKMVGVAEIHDVVHIELIPASAGQDFAMASGGGGRGIQPREIGDQPWIARRVVAPPCPASAVDPDDRPVEHPGAARPGAKGLRNPSNTQSGV